MRVQPRVQIVVRIVACVTAGLRTPGVSAQLARTTDAAGRAARAARKRRRRDDGGAGEQTELDE